MTQIWLIFLQKKTIFVVPVVSNDTNEQLLGRHTGYSHADFEIWWNKQNVRFDIWSVPDVDVQMRAKEISQNSSVLRTTLLSLPPTHLLRRLSQLQLWKSGHQWILSKNKSNAINRLTRLSQLFLAAPGRTLQSQKKWFTVDVTFHENVQNVSWWWTPPSNTLSISYQDII